ncbi:hypothetical protein TRE132_43260 [Pseudomonas chlororaphis subsp. aurantiaca]|nr:hypothetical protein TRE132_43260 [Pseudomonas chlororaphis subsp. aurantiaca]
MNKTTFLGTPETQCFVNWFADIIGGLAPLDFKHKSGTYKYLDQALSSYAWPYKKTTIKTPAGTLVLHANADFSTNKNVLDQLANGIQGSLNQAQPKSSELADWAQAIMTWGGVYTYAGKNRDKGNAGWLDGQRPTFTSYLQSSLAALRSEDGTTHCSLTDLRSNAGTTKVHSLLLPHFVIYDSRVAAALAWLVLSWSRQKSTRIPDELKFGCMRANTGKNNPKQRTPDKSLFPYFVPSGKVKTHHTHATWNLRANWVLQGALARLTPNNAQTNLSSREVEAALFMIGEDLTHALPVSS